MEIVHKERRCKKRKITLHKERIFSDIESLTYKLASTAITEDAIKDEVASDTGNQLDATIIDVLMNTRDAELRKRLSFCIADEEMLEVDNTNDIDEDFIYLLVLPHSFKDKALKVIVNDMNDYIVKGTLLDWYRKMGTTFGENLIEEVQKLESRIVDSFRSGIVYHPSMIYIHSYRNR